MFFINLVVLGALSVAVTETADTTPVLSKEFLNTQATIECRFILKPVHDMTRTYSHIVCLFYYMYIGHIVQSGSAF